MNEENSEAGYGFLIKTLKHIVCISFQMEKIKVEITKQKKKTTIYRTLSINLFVVLWLLLWICKGQFNTITTTT